MLYCWLIQCNSPIFLWSPLNLSSWRNEKATFKEKLVEIATEKVKSSEIFQIINQSMYINIFLLIFIKTLVLWRWKPTWQIISLSLQPGKTRNQSCEGKVAAQKFRPSNPPDLQILLLGPRFVIPFSDSKVEASFLRSASGSRPC